jgi:prepilin-type N-terminal cleavage/methylation domain-containing protein
MNSTSSKGFTLVELIVVVSIIMIFSGMSFAYYNSFTSSKKVEKEAQQLLDILQSARQRAITGENASEGGTYICSMANPFAGYRVDIISGGTSYTLSVLCGAIPHTLSTLRVDHSLTVGILGTANVTFAAATGLSNSDESNPTRVTINQNAVCQKAVQVSASGLVEEVDC